MIDPNRPSGCVELIGTSLIYTIKKHHVKIQVDLEGVGVLYGFCAQYILSFTQIYPGVLWFHLQPYDIYPLANEAKVLLETFISQQQYS